ncbi:MAG: NitT/TauT family transport system substrate-binding protein, partial [Natronomonas sp.]
GTEVFSTFAHDNGQIEQELTTEDIFDYNVYDGL